MRLSVQLILAMTLAAMAGGIAVAAEPAATPTAAPTATPTAALDLSRFTSTVTLSGGTFVPGSLALLPKESVGFIHISKIAGLEADLKRLAQESGVQIGKGEHPVLDLLAQRTGIRAGIDPEGCATIGFVDPKAYRDRYTIYVVPVADWDALLKETPNETMSAGLYALTTAAGPRFVARRGRYAVVTSSVRTMDAVADAETPAIDLSAETLALAAGPGPMFFLNVHRMTTIYQDDIATWFKAASGQVYDTPEAVAYADMLTAYMLGIADFLDQIETLQGSVAFGPEGVGLDLQVRFVDGASVAKFLSVQAPGAAAMPMPTDRPLVSAVTLCVDPKTRADLMLQATRFFLDKAPRPQPLQEGTKDQVFEAVQVFAGSLGPNITFLSAPAGPGLGLTADVTVFDLKDPEQFRRGLSLLVASWEALADQLNLYMKFETSPDNAEIDGVPLTVYVPRFRFGTAARHMEFRERLKTMYGPEGLVYRVAVVGDKAVVSSGSDLSLLKETIERLKKGEAAEKSPTLERLQQHLPAAQQAAIALNLPMYVAQSLQRGGTPAERIGTPDPGKEIAGLVLAAGGGKVHVSSYFPYEQIRLAMDLMKLRLRRRSPRRPSRSLSPPRKGRPSPPPPAPRRRPARLRRRARLLRPAPPPPRARPHRQQWKPLHHPTSSLSVFNLWVQSFQFYPGVGRGESPVDAFLLGVPLPVPGRAFLL